MKSDKCPIQAGAYITLDLSPCASGGIVPGKCDNSSGVNSGSWSTI